MAIEDILKNIVYNYQKKSNSVDKNRQAIAQIVQRDYKPIVKLSDNNHGFLVPKKSLNLYKNMVFEKQKEIHNIDKVRLKKLGEYELPDLPKKIPKKICPDGKILNVKTNRCGKIKKIKKTNSLERLLKKL